MTNRFKGLDLIDRVPDELWMEVHDIVQETGVQVRCTILDAWGWCTGVTQRDGMSREVEGGSGLGTRVHPWQIHVDVWQNQYNIVK